MNISTISRLSLILFFFSLSIIEVNCSLCTDISQYGRCSKNSACGCFHMIGAYNSGICGFLWTSCSNLDLCDSSTNACTKENHICVHHPRCNTRPVCYPVSMIDPRICSPITTTNTTTTTNIIPTITAVTDTTTATTTTTTAQPRKWYLTGNLGIYVAEHAASTLIDGTIMTTGGYTNNDVTNSVYLYNVSTKTWNNTNNMKQSRYEHTASTLLNGKVLVTGGRRSHGAHDSNILDTAELYDPITKIWSLIDSMNYKRYSHRETLLTNGKVLITGGDSRFTVSVILNTTELYNPSIDTWTVTGSMKSARRNHAACLLKNGKVLVAGGSQTSAELYDPATGQWTLTGSMKSAREYHTMSLLPDGQVLVTGGNNKYSLNSAELYDPVTGNWSYTDSMHYARTKHTATILQNGNVLVAGGYNTTATNRVEIYDSLTRKWTTIYERMNCERYSHTASLLPNGKVLVVGGISSENQFWNCAELY